MSREIKFRAWMREQEYMTHLKGFYKNTNTCWFTLIEDGLNGQHVSVRVPQDAILMQYTGLKDKDGVEIYEGDVVKWDEKNGGNIEDVQWSEDELAWICHNPKDNGSWLCCADRIGTVIGNIHENPELLGE